MKSIRLSILGGLVLLFHMKAAAMNPTQLKCEYRENPLGVEAANPRLTWLLEAPGRGNRQTAYQVLVASAPELLNQDKGDLWDSGKTTSDQSAQVEYAG